MQFWTDSIGDLVELSAACVLVFYVPLAKTFWRAVLAPFAAFALWSFIRWVAEIVYWRTEQSVPGIGFVIAPFVVGVYAGIYRGLIDLILRIPALSRLRASIR